MNSVLSSTILLSRLELNCLTGAGWLMMGQPGRKQFLPPVVSPVFPEGQDFDWLKQRCQIPGMLGWGGSLLVWRLSPHPAFDLLWPTEPLAH